MSMLHVINNLWIKALLSLHCTCNFCFLFLSGEGWGREYGRIEGGGREDMSGPRKQSKNAKFFIFVSHQTFKYHQKQELKILIDSLQHLSRFLARQANKYLILDWNTEAYFWKKFKLFCHRCHFKAHEMCYLRFSKTWVKGKIAQLNGWDLFWISW